MLLLQPTLSSAAIVAPSMRDTDKTRLVSHRVVLVAIVIIYLYDLNKE
jgi:hypothetical protein